MKTNIKNILTSVVGFCAGAMILASCTSNFEEFNRNPGEPTEPEIKPYLRVLAFEQMITNVYSSQENSYQMNQNLIGDPYGRYLSIANSGWSASFSTFNASAGWLNYPFEDVLPKFNGAWTKAQELLAEDEVPAKHLIGWSNILRVAAMHRLADMYGPIPYSAVGSGAINSKYDSVEEVYTNMMKDLDVAIADITAYIDANPQNIVFLDGADVVYKGDLKKWVVFANSLKLRLAMRTVYIQPSIAQQKAEEAVKHKYGVIVANSEAPSYRFESGGNPVHKMSTAWGDCMPAADIITYMNGYADPRIEKYFKTATIKDAEGKYVGVRTGVPLEEKSVMGQFSKVTYVEDDPMIWITAAEVAFLRAEGALRGWDMGGTAQGFYETGVQLSFDQWKAQGVNDYLNDNVSTQADYEDPRDAYIKVKPNGEPEKPYQSIKAISDITIKWEGADFERNLERIITQKWIATYPLGTEAWSEQRRTGYPKFFPVLVNGSTDPSLTTHLASRIPFAPSEKDRNRENYDKAVQMLGAGGDNYGTRLWWDAKPNKW